MAIASLLKSWKTLASIGVLIGILFYWWYLTDTIDDQQMQITNLQQKMERKQNSIDDLKDGIDDRNEKITNLSERSKQKLQEIKDKQQQLEQQRKQHKKKVDKIMQQKSPQTCEQAIDYLHDRKDQLTWDD